jgi:hypothetical protein
LNALAPVVSFITGWPALFLFVTLSIGFVWFITEGDGDDTCDEPNVDLAFPAEENHSNEKTQSGPIVESAAAAA